MGRILFVILFAINSAIAIMKLSEMMMNDKSLAGGPAILMHGLIGFALAILAGIFLSKLIKRFLIVNTILMLILLAVASFIALKISKDSDNSPTHPKIPTKEQSFLKIEIQSKIETLDWGFFAPKVQEGLPINR